VRRSWKTSQTARQLNQSKQCTVIGKGTSAGLGRESGRVGRGNSSQNAALKKNIRKVSAWVENVTTPGPDKRWLTQKCLERGRTWHS